MNISKQILERVNTDIKDKLNLNQLTNTADAIDLFDNIENKQDRLMIICDISEFYPSINEDLFNNAIQFAQKHTPLTSLEVQILLNARQSVLHFDGDTWTKTTKRHLRRDDGRI